MASPSFPEPIARLLAGHADTRRQLRILTAIPAARPEPSVVQAAIDWMDGPAQTQRRIVEQVLFPALIESMAGSDAVCLKGMTQGLAQQGTNLGHRWRQTIRSELAQPQPDAALLMAWIEAFLAYLQRIDEEILPMANRLLDDSALNDLARATESGHA